MSCVASHRMVCGNALRRPRSCLPQALPVCFSCVAALKVDFPGFPSVHPPVRRHHGPAHQCDPEPERTVGVVRSSDDLARISVVSRSDAVQLRLQHLQDLGERPPSPREEEAKEPRSHRPRVDVEVRLEVVNGEQATAEEGPEPGR